MPDETDPAGRGGKSRFNEVGVEPARAVTDELLLEEIRALRRENGLLLDRIGNSTDATAAATQGTERALRVAPLELERNRGPSSRPSRPKVHG
jgi:hypothetical protein